MKQTRMMLLAGTAIAQLSLAGAGFAQEAATVAFLMPEPGLDPL